MIITVITKITINNNQNSNNKKKSPLYIEKPLSSKRTNPMKIQMLKILVIKLLDTFFNINPQMMP